MISTLNKVIYKAFGLNIESEIPLPELETVFNHRAEIDLVIEYADLTKLWNENAEPNRYCLVKDHTVLFRVPDTAIYFIENGNKITVSPMKGAHGDHVRLYVLGSCLGALLMQRRILPLHGSAIAINGKAYTIIGDSGAGKSTLASAFLKKGFQLLSDDVIPVSLSSEKIPMITPAYPQQKLWQESLDAFGVSSANYKPIIQRETKFAIPVTSQFLSKKMPLAGVFELVKTDVNEIQISPISGLERLHTLFNHTYRNFLLAQLGLIEWHFQLTASIANQIQAFHIERPIDQFTANDLTDLILNIINKE